MQLLIEAIGFGIAAGAVIALGAVGFSLQFGISNILNITYGSLMTLAAYIGLFLIDRGVNPWADARDRGRSSWAWCRSRFSAGCWLLWPGEARGRLR